MDIFLKITLILHFVGLALGMGVGGIAFSQLANFYGKSGDVKPILFEYGSLLSKIGHIGLGLLWVTGLILVFFKWGLDALPNLFWVKLAFVVALSATVGIGSKSYRLYVGGQANSSGRVAMMSKLSALSGTLALILAVFAFAG